MNRGEYPIVFGTKQTIVTHLSTRAGKYELLNNYQPVFQGSETASFAGLNKYFLHRKTLIIKQGLRF